jgi:hypothetical protein
MHAPREEVPEPSSPELDVLEELAELGERPPLDPLLMRPTKATDTR